MRQTKSENIAAVVTLPYNRLDAQIPIFGIFFFGIVPFTNPVLKRKIDCKSIES
jgi:hypothetical protein